MTDKPSVLVDPHFRRMDEIFSPDDRERLDRTVEVIWGRDEPMPVHEATDALSSARAVICSGWRYGPVPSGLRAIIDVSGAFPSGLDYQSCFARGIRVLSAAPAFGPQVAEMALGLALAVGREIVDGDAAMRAGAEKWLHAGNETTVQLYEQPVGMIGYGSLARSLRPLLAPFRCSLSAYDPWLSDGFLRSQGVQPLTLPELLNSSQVIFVLASPTMENGALLSREMLEQIRPGSTLILISRAHVVDFDALTDLLLSGRFRAGIDVFPDEPLAADHPIRSAPGTVLSAHRAGSVKEGLWEIGRMVIDDLEAIAADLPPQRLQQAQPELINRLVQHR
ncbi:NAD(P)-dependent oxidoreductase [Microlunatus sp. Gsoil 973]|uniref:NAD(P)-dependent oxidoreductase n=1 Tax=Microlunatus sp. Gsoil 973 TaxID=2672569 RepID=UPI0012B46D20|nr:NAD(P)-dependent oxidoreductase [Microlunatus sp. Gsoil 973]QGN34948.1 hydroxyacid dehydrogenase [Microlunatus sp. Gsoil 973]